MTSFKKRTGTAALTFALVGGLVGFSPIAGATSGYGHHSNHHGGSNGNSVRTTNTTVQKTTIKNDNDIKLKSSNYQDATSGSVNATHNTTVGSVSSGSASNSNSVSGSVTVDNSNSGAALMDAARIVPSGSENMSYGSHDSHGNNNTTTTNSTTSELSLTNNNDVNVDISSSQDARSGNVTVSGNTTAGNATSGNATNTNHTTFDISVLN